MSDRWVCGVDCTQFLSVRNALQRDVTEPAFWSRAGWTVFRVSPAMWLEQSDKVIGRVLAHVEGRTCPRHGWVSPRG